MRCRTAASSCSLLGSSARTCKGSSRQPGGVRQTTSTGEPAHTATPTCAHCLHLVSAPNTVATSATRPGSACSAWCRMLLEATRLANEMQRNLPWCEGHLSRILTAISSGLSDDSVGSYFPTGEMPFHSSTACCPGP